MKKEKNILNAVDILEKNLKTCPHCGSGQVWRIQRSETEKISCYLSNGEFAIKKYLCQSCQHTTLLHRNNIKPSDARLLTKEEKTMIPFIACAKCAAEKLQISMLSHLEGNIYYSKTGKIAIRKLICMNCNEAIILSKEDYEIVSNQDF